MGLRASPSPTAVLELSTRVTLCASYNVVGSCASPSPTALLEFSTLAILYRSYRPLEKRAGCRAAKLYASCNLVGPCASPSPAALLESSTRATLCRGCSPTHSRGGTPVIWGLGLHAGALCGRSHGVHTLEAASVLAYERQQLCSCCTAYSVGTTAAVYTAAILGGRAGSKLNVQTAMWCAASTTPP